MRMSGAIPVRRVAQDACMRTLTRRELNRALLARQLLLRRHGVSVTRAVEHVAGLQAQWPPSPYLGLWTRLDGFTPDQLVRAVARRSVVKATLMRTTLHIVSAADYLAYAGIYRRVRIRELERQLAALGEEADFAEEGERLAAFAAEQPRTRGELLGFLERPKLRIEERSPWLTWYGLAAHAGLVNGPESSAWRARTRRAGRSCPHGRGSAPMACGATRLRATSCGATSLRSALRLART
jgi:winged helix DNA-binding protein